MRSSRATNRSLARSALGLAVVFSMAVPLAAAADYRLQPGDVVELSAAGIPDLKHRSTVGLDGQVMLPVVGAIKAAGLGVAELRTKVQELAATKLIRRRGEDGREYSQVLAPDQLVLSIAEYRPVYLNGDVAKPGEQTFRPGMTVLQAVALAGGYDIMRFRMNNPFLELADIRADYDSLWVQFAKDQAIAQRLQAELDGKTEFKRDALEQTPVSSDVAGQIEQLESERLKARNRSFDKEKTYLKEAVTKEGSRLSVLGEQQQKEKAGADIDTQELERLQELFRKGQTPITRVIDARRTILLSSTRLLQTIAQAGTVERQRDELGMKLQKLSDDRRQQLLEELQEAGARLATTRARLQAVGDKLTYTGMVRSQLVRGTNVKPDIVIVHKNGSDVERRVVDENAELSPGDVVEVALQKALTDQTGTSRGEQTGATRSK
jgi:polysaccharide biosynthesis/export protein